MLKKEVFTLKSTKVTKGKAAQSLENIPLDKSQLCKKTCFTFSFTYEAEKPTQMQRDRAFTLIYSQNKVTQANKANIANRDKFHQKQRSEDYAMKERTHLQLMRIEEYPS